jgi:hypothetical protein
VCHEAPMPTAAPWTPPELRLHLSAVLRRSSHRPPSTPAKPHIAGAFSFSDQCPSEMSPSSLSSPLPAVYLTGAAPVELHRRRPRLPRLVSSPFPPRAERRCRPRAGDHIAHHRLPLEINSVYAYTVERRRQPCHVGEAPSLRELSPPPSGRRFPRPAPTVLHWQSVSPQSSNVSRAERCLAMPATSPSYSHPVSRAGNPVAVHSGEPRCLLPADAEAPSAAKSLPS